MSLLVLPPTSTLAPDPGARGLLCSSAVSLATCLSYIYQEYYSDCHSVSRWVCDYLLQDVVIVGRKCLVSTHFCKILMLLSAMLIHFCLSFFCRCIFDLLALVFALSFTRRCEVPLGLKKNEQLCFGYSHSKIGRFGSVL